MCLNPTTFVCYLMWLVKSTCSVKFKGRLEEYTLIQSWPKTMVQKPHDHASHDLAISMMKAWDNLLNILRLGQGCANERDMDFGHHVCPSCDVKTFDVYFFCYKIYYNKLYTIWLVFASHQSPKNHTKKQKSPKILHHLILNLTRSNGSNSSKIVGDFDCFFLMSI